MGRCRAVYQPDPEAPWKTVGLLKCREVYEPPAHKKKIVSAMSLGTSLIWCAPS